MKTIGLIGGIGWASSAEYYRIINELSLSKFGKKHSAKIVLISLDHSEFTEKAFSENSQDIENFLTG